MTQKEKLEVNRKELEEKIISLNKELADVNKELTQLKAVEAQNIISEMKKMIAHLEDLGYLFMVECFDTEFGTYEWVSPRSIDFK